MEQLEATIKCGHCGNVGNCQVKASYTYPVFKQENFNGESGDYYEEEHEEECEQRAWYLFQCVACARPIFAECVTPDEKKFGKMPDVFKNSTPFFFIGDEGDIVNSTLFNEFSPYNRILYPQEKSIDQWMLPHGVSKAYCTALRVQKIDAEAFAIMVGRTLEEICYCEKATGKALADKIKSLANSGRIPQVLADMFTQLRLLRNLAAHKGERDYVVKEEDISIIREFIDAILEYLYIAPMKIDHLKLCMTGKFLDELM